MVRTLLSFFAGAVVGGVGGPLATFLWMGILRPATQAPRAFLDALLEALQHTPQPAIGGVLVGGGLGLVLAGLTAQRDPAAPRWPAGFEDLGEALARAYPEGVPPLERRPLFDLLVAQTPPAVLSKILVTALGSKHGLSLNDPNSGASSEEARSVVRERLKFFGLEL